MLKSRRPAQPEDVAREATAVGPPEPGADGAHVLSEFERLMRKPGCPACHYVEEVERSFFSWLQIESFSVAEVQVRLHASMGMCPVHSRRLVEEIGEGHVMTIVVREALAGARQRARDELEPGPCPACDAIAFGAQRARQMVLEGLSDPAGSPVLRASRHLRSAFPRAAPQLERSALEPLARRLLRSLAETDEAAVVALLAGTDPDAARRARWRECLPDPSTTRSTIEGLSHRIEIEACPVCLSTGLGDREYVRWHAERVAQGDRSLRNDPGELCSAHLHDLALADRALAAPAIEHKRVTTTGKLERLLGRLGDMPEPSRRGRRATGDGRRAGHGAPRDRHPSVLPGPQRARGNRAVSARTGGCGTRPAGGAGALRAQPRLVSAACGPDLRPAAGPAGTTSRRRAARSSRVGGGRDRPQVRLGLPPRVQRSRAARMATGSLAQIDGRVFEGAGAPVSDV